MIAPRREALSTYYPILTSGYINQSVHGERDTLTQTLKIYEYTSAYGSLTSSL